jgi:membrane protease YdiL (CAAX protease family)
MPINLPVAALMAFMPMAAALILVSRESGWSGAKGLLRRAVAFRRDRIVWYVVAAAAMPLALLIEYAVMRLSGAALPEPSISLAALPVFFVMFIIGGFGEEIGWQGYVYPALRERWSALDASLLIAVVWALWHTIPFLQGERSGEWILFQSLGMIPLRIITVWIFANAGQNVLAAVVFHAMCNVAQYLFPNYGSHYDPHLNFLVMGAAAVAIVALWGPATLAGAKGAQAAR